MPAWELSSLVRVLSLHCFISTLSRRIEQSTKCLVPHKAKHHFKPSSDLSQTRSFSDFSSDSTEVDATELKSDSVQSADAQYQFIELFTPLRRQKQIYCSTATGLQGV